MPAPTGVQAMVGLKHSFAAVLGSTGFDGRGGCRKMGVSGFTVRYVGASKGVRTEFPPRWVRAVRYRSPGTWTNTETGQALVETQAPSDHSPM